LVVEEGQEYGPAKRRAVKQLGLNARSELPDNDLLEDAIRDYIAVFCADTQPAELLALRELALLWMQRLQAFRPHLTGAIWRGTATRLSDIHLNLYCDDCKSAEITLIDKGMDYDVSSTKGPRGHDVDRLSMSVECPALGEPIGLHLTILDLDDQRSAPSRDSQGRSRQGDEAALRALLDTPSPMPTFPHATNPA
jgi:hypothetical protein